MHASLAQLFSELVDGPPSEGAYMLNSGDAGLLAVNREAAGPRPRRSARHPAEPLSPRTSITSVMESSS